jgi:hypothetical protein
MKNHTQQGVYGEIKGQYDYKEMEADAINLQAAFGPVKAVIQEMEAKYPNAINIRLERTDEGVLDIVTFYDLAHIKPNSIEVDNGML